VIISEGAETEKRPVIVADAARDSAISPTVPELVRERASQTPGATALRWAGTDMSYAELVRGAAQVARHLRGLGIGQDDAVGLCLGRSPVSIQAALGAMEAGAAYLPLDPAHPTGRLVATLGDARARVLLTDETHQPRFEGSEITALLADDLVSSSQDRRRALDEAVHATLDDVAYVIYTSGSTGRPKGVDVTHRNLLNLVRWHQDAFGVTAADRGTAIAGPAFDAVVWEVWPYLAAGASVSIADDETRLSAERLQEWLAAEGATISFMPTALAERALALSWPAASTSLRILLTGADSLHIYPRRDIPFRFVNNYGPTECAVVATSGPVTPDHEDGRLPSIGRPITNVQIHVLDADRQPVADGEFGELYIGGAGVARGYRNHPELTAERFLVDPWSAVPGARMYRTGDLGRYDKDGNIEFGGRVDAQVKIRGNRVEPEEVALTLNQGPAVLASAVVAPTDAAGNRHLVAFVVARPGETVSRSDLGTFLRGRLPEYMVPSVFVPIDALPMTPNGKVDRVSLLAMAEADSFEPMPDDGEPYVAPSTTLERRMAKMTSELLNVDRVSVDADFFLLGGHSLLATQLIVQIRDSFGVDVPLRSLFDQPTIRELAVVVEDLLLEQADATSVAAG
jgi:amino acid adenylation domain-containing protein